MHSQADTTAHNADFDEIGKFTKLADEWWDRMGALARWPDGPASSRPRAERIRPTCPGFEPEENQFPRQCRYVNWI